MAAAHVITNGFGLGGNGAIPYYLTLGYGDFGAVAEDEAAESVGGVAVRKRRRRNLQPLGASSSQKVPVDGTLYRQMFPEKPVDSTAVDATPTTNLLPALLLAWLAIQDD